MGHEEKKSQSTAACRGERLGKPVFCVSLTRDERGLQSNLKRKKSNSFVRREVLFHTICVIKSCSTLERLLRLDLFLNYCVDMDCFDALPCFPLFIFSPSPIKFY